MKVFDKTKKLEQEDMKTPFERFEAMARGLVNVSKRELDRKVAHSRLGKRRRAEKMN